MGEVSQEEKVALLKQAYQEKWTTFQILDLWLPLGFKDRADMSNHVGGLYEDRMTRVAETDIPTVIVYRFWCEYQAACIDGSLEAAKQVSQENIFRRMLAI